VQGDDKAILFSPKDAFYLVQPITLDAVSRMLCLIPASSPELRKLPRGNQVFMACHWESHTLSYELALAPRHRREAAGFRRTRLAIHLITEKSPAPCPSPAASQIQPRSSFNRAAPSTSSPGAFRPGNSWAVPSIADRVCILTRARRGALQRAQATACEPLIDEAGKERRRQRVGETNTQSNPKE
jgi:hypothetical protein